MRDIVGGLRTELFELVTNLFDVPTPDFGEIINGVAFYPGLVFNLDEKDHDENKSINFDDATFSTALLKKDQAKELLNGSSSDCDFDGLLLAATLPRLHALIIERSHHNPNIFSTLESLRSEATEKWWGQGGARNSTALAFAKGGVAHWFGMTKDRDDVGRDCLLANDPIFDEMDEWLSSAIQFQLMEFKASRRRLLDAQILETEREARKKALRQAIDLWLRAMWRERSLRLRGSQADDVLQKVFMKFVEKLRDIGPSLKPLAPFAYPVEKTGSNLSDMGCQTVGKSETGLETALRDTKNELERMKREYDALARLVLEDNFTSTGHDSPDGADILKKAHEAAQVRLKGSWGRNSEVQTVITFSSLSEGDLLPEAMLRRDPRGLENRVRLLSEEWLDVDGRGVEAQFLNREVEDLESEIGFLEEKLERSRTSLATETEILKERQRIAIERREAVSELLETIASDRAELHNSLDPIVNMLEEETRDLEDLVPASFRHRLPPPPVLMTHASKQQPLLSKEAPGNANTVEVSKIPNTSSYVQPQEEVHQKATTKLKTNDNTDNQRGRVNHNAMSNPPAESKNKTEEKKDIIHSAAKQHLPLVNNKLDIPSSFSNNNPNVSLSIEHITSNKIDSSSSIPSSQLTFPSVSAPAPLTAAAIGPSSVTQSSALNPPLTPAVDIEPAVIQPSPQIIATTLKSPASSLVPLVMHSPKKISHPPYTVDPTATLPTSNTTENIQHSVATDDIDNPEVSDEVFLQQLARTSGNRHAKRRGALISQCIGDAASSPALVDVRSTAETVAALTSSDRTFVLKLLTSPHLFPHIAAYIQMTNDSHAILAAVRRMELPDGVRIVEQGDASDAKTCYLVQAGGLKLLKARLGRGGETVVRSLMPGEVYNAASLLDAPACGDAGAKVSVETSSHDVSVILWAVNGMQLMENIRFGLRRSELEIRRALKRASLRVVRGWSRTPPTSSDGKSKVRATSGRSSSRTPIEPTAEWGLCARGENTSASSPSSKQEAGKKKGNKHLKETQDETQVVSPGAVVKLFDALDPTRMDALLTVLNSTTDFDTLKSGKQLTNFSFGDDWHSRIESRICGWLNLKHGDVLLKAGQMPPDVIWIVDQGALKVTGWTGDKLALQTRRSSRAGRGAVVFGEAVEALAIDQATKERGLDKFSSVSCVVDWGKALTIIVESTTARVLQVPLEIVDDFVEGGWLHVLKSARVTTDAKNSETMFAPEISEELDIDLEPMSVFIQSSVTKKKKKAGIMSYIWG